MQNNIEENNIETMCSWEFYFPDPFIFVIS